jgi:hypothetical protein
MAYSRVNFAFTVFTVHRIGSKLYLCFSVNVKSVFSVESETLHSADQNTTIVKCLVILVLMSLVNGNLFFNNLLHRLTYVSYLQM